MGSVHIASKHGAHPIQVGLWKKAVKERLHTLFDKTNIETKRIKELEEQVDELHRLIGTRDEEITWLKKKIYLIAFTNAVRSSTPTVVSRS